MAKQYPEAEIVFNQFVQFAFGGGGIGKELGIALEAVVVNIHGDDLIAGVGAADSLQLALHIEAFIAFLCGQIDLVIADPGIGF